MTDGDLPPISGRALYRALPEVHLNLSEVLDAGEEDALLLVARDVLADVGVPRAFGVSHLAEDASVEGGDAFDGVHGAVGVPGHFVGGLTIQVGVLEGDLAVLNQLGDLLRRGMEASLAVGDRDRVDIADVGVA